MIMEDFLGERVPGLSLKRYIGFSQEEVVGESLREETGEMKAQRCEVSEAKGHLKLKVQHSKDRGRRATKEGRRGKSNTDQVKSRKHCVVCGAKSLVWPGTSTKLPSSFPPRLVSQESDGS